MSESEAAHLLVAVVGPAVLAALILVALLASEGVRVPLVTPLWARVRAAWVRLRAGVLAAGRLIRRKR